MESYTMGDSSVHKDDEARRGKRENGDSRQCSDSQKHRRSKSTSDQHLGVSRYGDLHSTKEHSGIHASPISTRADRERTPLHHRSTYIQKDKSNHRASLERDIEQLQLHLQQEKSMRRMLDRAMGRVSSTLSPGHRHFAAQTKELITEIELLEEEVANREQHVLSLYRSIFEHCVSRVSSVQSSGISSPAQTKKPSRKHPSIISSAFCSSKKFPLRPWHASVTINDVNKRTSKGNDASQFPEKNSGNSAKTCLRPAKGSATEKTPMQQTLKDHLYQCPSKLSEEMVRCMASVYCWLCSATSTDADPQKRRSPILSRSSTNVIIPQRGAREEQDCSCKSLVEISWISTDKSQFPRASYAINNYRLLVEQLERVTLDQMETNAKLAFWINIYNALVMHAYLAYGIPHNSLRRLALFHKSCYNISGQIISANAIEHSILCFRTPRIGRWLETILSTALRKKSVEERQSISSRFGVLNSEPLLCFALCTGALSDPVLKVYTASNIKEELEAAKREFLQANIVVKNSKKVFLPKILERFSREASLSLDDLMKWVAENIDKKLLDSIQKCMESKSNYKKASQIGEWLPYSSRFRYVFSKDLAEKPWWV